MTGGSRWSIHGVLTVEICGAEDHWLERLQKRWASVADDPGESAADLTIEFRDDLRPEPLRFVGRNWAGFGDAGFHLLDPLTGDVTASLPLDRVGGSMHVVCAAGRSSVPLLDELVLYGFLGKGWAPLHGSAFEHRGRGAVVMGWPKGGKTGALLALMNRGAQFVGEEWVIVGGGRVLGLPSRVNVSDWQISHVPGLSLSRRERATLRIIRGAAAAVEEWAGRSRAPGARFAGKALPGLRRQLKISRTAESLFPGAVSSLSSSFDAAFLVVAHDADEIVVESVDSAQTARRMAVANAYEQRDLLDLYRAHLFAFPDRPNPLLESAVERQARALEQAFASVPMFSVAHPYGADIAPLSEVIDAHLPG